MKELVHQTKDKGHCEIFHKLLLFKNKSNLNLQYLMRDSAVRDALGIFLSLVIDFVQVYHTAMQSFTMVEVLEMMEISFSQVPHFASVQLTRRASSSRHS
jgi:hypothetical protein